MRTSFSRRISRRRFIQTGAGAAAMVAMPYLSRAADRPVVSHGVQSGDVTTDGGVVWARADRPAQMLVEVSTIESFKDARALPPIAALPESDFTAKVLLENLPAGQEIFYRIKFRDLSHPDISGEAVTGRFRTAPADRRDVSFVWGGDVAGQGWGINPDDGGMKSFAVMRQHRPDFENLSVAICGDVKHSRVARSDVHALSALGVRDIRLCGPASLMPDAAEFPQGRFVEDFDQAIEGVDAVIMLRLQKERMAQTDLPDEAAYFRQYGLDTTRLAKARKGCLVMHPGPINRGIEIASDVADGAQSRILEQVGNGVFIRMAVLGELLAR